MATPLENKPYPCDRTAITYVFKKICGNDPHLFLKPSPLLMITGGDDLALWFLTHSVFRMIH